MFKIFQKIKINLKKVALFASLFLAVFFGLFYLVNFDFRPNKNYSPETGEILNKSVDRRIPATD